MRKPFNLNKWIEENHHLLKPPVANKQIYLDNEDFIVIIIMRMARSFSISLKGTYL